MYDRNSIRIDAICHILCFSLIPVEDTEDGNVGHFLQPDVIIVCYLYLVTTLFRSSATAVGSCNIWELERFQTTEVTFKVVQEQGMMPFDRPHTISY